jgi:hypothetical protein
VSKILFILGNKEKAFQFMHLHDFISYREHTTINDYGRELSSTAGASATRVGIFSVLPHDELDPVLHVFAVHGPRALVIDALAGPLGLLVPGTNVIITIFGDFSNFRQKMAFFF